MKVCCPDIDGSIHLYQFNKIKYSHPELDSGSHGIPDRVRNDVKKV